MYRTIKNIQIFYYKNNEKNNRNYMTLIKDKIEQIDQIIRNYNPGNIEPEGGFNCDDIHRMLTGIVDDLIKFDEKLEKEKKEIEIIEKEINDKQREIADLKLIHEGKLCPNCRTFYTEKYGWGEYHKVCKCNSK